MVSGPIATTASRSCWPAAELDIEADVVSDTAPLNGLIGALLDAVPGVAGDARRDQGRCGDDTLTKIARAADVGVLASEDAIPVRDEVRGACETARHRPDVRPVRGADGRGRALAKAPILRCRRLRGHPLGADAAVIGRVVADQPGIVRLKTSFGGPPGSSTCSSATLSPPASADATAARVDVRWCRYADTKRTSTCWPGRRGVS